MSTLSQFTYPSLITYPTQRRIKVTFGPNQISYQFAGQYCIRSSDVRRPTQYRGLYANTHNIITQARNSQTFKRFCNACHRRVSGKSYYTSTASILMLIDNHTKSLKQSRSFNDCRVCFMYCTHNELYENLNRLQKI